MSRLRPYPHGVLLSGSKGITWTKVYFILVFACVQQPNSAHASVCLENNVSNLNDVFGILGEFKKASALLPDYVSNISYEAYKSDVKPGSSSSIGHGKTQYYLTMVTLVSVLTFVVVVIFLLAVLVRQQQVVKRIKAPVWFPPVTDNPYSKPTTLFSSSSRLSDHVS